MELIFVYNADSGILNLLKDAVHKMVMPDTYPCSLCALTYGAVSEKRIWRKFRKNSGYRMRFLHRDEFEAEFSEQYEYPLVLLRNPVSNKLRRLSVIFDSKSLDEMQDIHRFIHVLNKEIDLVNQGAGTS